MGIFHIPRVSTRFKALNANPVSAQVSFRHHSHIFGLPSCLLLIWSPATFSLLLNGLRQLISSLLKVVVGCSKMSDD